MAEQSRTIRSALVTVPFGGDYLDQVLQALAPAEIARTSSEDSAGIAEALETADVAIIEGDLDSRFVQAPHLRWVHCDHSGLTRSAMPEVFEKGLLVSGSAGRSAQALAQHVFYFALSLTFDAYGLHDQQQTRTWRGLPGYSDRLSLSGKTLGVIGLGHTGIEVARLGAAFGMRILAYRRQDTPAPEPVERLYSAVRGDTIDELLRASDVVALATHLSDETYHLIGERELAIMKSTAFLINMSRGAVVDESALVQALESGVIAGAGSDVFEREPLPADSALWTTRNMMVTPHATPSLPDKTQRSVEMIVENIRRYRAGEALLNPLKAHDVYTRT
jgi:phosphoglycerate dehydrogenase-like enzyme